MIEEKINKLRKKLDQSIFLGEKYEIIYKYSIELDELIASYYLEKIKINN